MSQRYQILWGFLAETTYFRKVPKYRSRIESKIGDMTCFTSEEYWKDPSLTWLGGRTTLRAANVVEAAFAAQGFCNSLARRWTGELPTLNEGGELQYESTAAAADSRVIGVHMITMRIVLDQDQARQTR